MNRRTKKRQWKFADGRIDSWPTPAAEASPDVHTKSYPNEDGLPEFKKHWVETRYAPNRGWFSILWPWPESFYILHWGKLKQGPGVTLPFFWKTRREAVEWAWTLADSEPQETYRIKRLTA